MRVTFTNMKTTLSVLMVIAAIGVMTSAMSQHAVMAKIPEGSLLKLPLEVEMYTNGAKVKDVTVWAEYKDEVEKFKVNMRNEFEHEVKFNFEPQVRTNFLDFYKVCVENHKTDEVRCQTGYWFPYTDSTYMRILVP